MKRAEYARWKTHQKGKGFSLTELVIVIIIIAILALAVFAGGSAAIRKAKISRATSDLHNFDVALQTYMFSNRDPVKLTILSPKENFNKVVDGLNPFLPMGYTLKSVTLPTSGNIFSTLSFLNVYESEKKDPWDNPYYFLIDPTARNAGETEYYFIVMSAGPNAQANVGGPLDKDDIFLLCEYNNGTVTTNVYNMSTDTKDLTGSPLTRGETSLISSTNGSSPRNTGKAAKDIAHTHNWKTETNTSPTCTSSGYKKTRCIICGEINEQTIPANGHTWSTSVTKQATCTESGITSRTCTICGQKIDSVIPPKGHSWDAGTVTKEPGIGTEGVKTRTCTVCHETREDVIPSLPTLAAGASWFKSSSAKSTITKITLQAGYSPTGGEDETWDAGNNLKAYRTGTEVIIAGDGHAKIYATNLKQAFKDFTKLTAIENLTILDTSSVSDFTSTFENCGLIASLDVSKFDTSKATTMNSMFSKCGSLTSLNLSNFDTNSVTDMYYLFYNCKSLASLDISSFDTSSVTNMRGMFANCSSLASLDVSNFDTGSVTNMQDMFASCSRLTSLDVSNFNTSSVTNMHGMFYSCSRLVSLDLSSFDTSSVTTMELMFTNCSSLTSLDVSNFDTSKVTNMQDMFTNCSSLTSLDVSNFDTSSVTNMRSMFYNCSRLTSLDVSNFDTSSVTNMQSMFTSCSSLTSLDLSNFDTSSVTTMESMFGYCRSLKSVNVSSFNTSEVKNMNFMFLDCNSLTSLDLSSFSTESLKDTNQMFNRCYAISTIYVSDRWSNKNIINRPWMFGASPKLCGGNGTKFTADNDSSKTYARIDTAEAPGYFTYKAAE